MKKWISIIVTTLIFLNLPSFTTKIRGIQLNESSILLSRIKICIILIIFGAFIKIFATPLGNISFKTTPQFMKKNSNAGKYINRNKSSGADLIISGILIALISILLRFI